MATVLYYNLSDVGPHAMATVLYYISYLIGPTSSDTQRVDYQSQTMVVAYRIQG